VCVADFGAHEVDAYDGCSYARRRCAPATLARLWHQPHLQRRVDEQRELEDR
jgi:hypothetical protein